MNTMRSIALLAGFAIASASHASVYLCYTLKSAAVDGNTAYPHGKFGDTGLQVASIYVHGLAPGDVVLSFFASASAPLVIETNDPNGFFNANDLGQGSAKPNPAFFSTFPELQWDTYFAIDDAAIAFSPFFPWNTAHSPNGENINTVSAVSWFVTVPGSVVVGSDPILAGQFAFSEYHSLTLNLNVVVQRAGNTIEFTNLPLFIPAATPSICPPPCALRCPPSGPSDVYRAFRITGSPTSTSWSWLIKPLSPPGSEPLMVYNVDPVDPVLDDLDGDGIAGTVGDLTWRFADSINDYRDAAGCDVALLEAWSTYPHCANPPCPPGTIHAHLVVKLRSNFELHVGPAGDCVNCEVLIINTCPFNATIEEIPLSGNDCNGNSIDDTIDIALGTSQDANGNGIPDECENTPCPGDLDNTGNVGVSDLLILLANWGPCPKGPCVGDLYANGTIGVGDLLNLLANWGPCL